MHAQASQRMVLRLHVLGRASIGRELFFNFMAFGAYALALAALSGCLGDSCQGSACYAPVRVLLRQLGATSALSCCGLVAQM